MSSLQTRNDLRPSLFNLRKLKSLDLSFYTLQRDCANYLRKIKTSHTISKALSKFTWKSINPYVSTYHYEEIVLFFSEEDLLLVNPWGTRDNYSIKLFDQKMSQPYQYIYSMVPRLIRSQTSHSIRAISNESSMEYFPNQLLGPPSGISVSTTNNQTKSQG